MNSTTSPAIDNAAPSSLLDSAIQAHGGRERWERVQSLQFQLRFIGRILATKFKSPRLRQIRGQVDTRQIRTVLYDFPHPGIRGVFTPERLWFETMDGVFISEREVKRNTAGQVPRRLIWDDYDLLYFLGYAAWNYFCTPYLFLLPDFHTREGQPWREKDGSEWRRLHVTYPAGFAAHCREQCLYFDSDGLLRRLDYTAEVFSPFARGAHYCEQHKHYEGLSFPTYRRVMIRRPSGHPLRTAPLLEGWVDDISVQWHTPHTTTTHSPHNTETTP